VGGSRRGVAPGDCVGLGQKGVDGLAEAIGVVSLQRKRVTIAPDHVGGGFRVEVIKVNISVGTLKINHGVLARFCSQAVLIVVIEKVVKTGSVDVHVGRRNYTKTPRHRAGQGSCGASRETRIIVGRINTER